MLTTFFLLFRLKDTNLRIWIDRVENSWKLRTKSLFAFTGEKAYFFYSLSFWGEGGCALVPFTLFKIGHCFCFCGRRWPRKMLGPIFKAWLWLRIFSPFGFMCPPCKKENLHRVQVGRCVLCRRDASVSLSHTFLPTLMLLPLISPPSFTVGAGTFHLPLATALCRLMLLKAKKGSRTICSCCSRCHFFPHPSSPFCSKCSPGYKWQSPGRKPALK